MVLDVFNVPGSNLHICMDTHGMVYLEVQVDLVSRLMMRKGYGVTIWVGYRGS